MGNLWVTPDDLDIYDLSESEYAPEACKTASYILWGMSGRKYNGDYKVTERYVKNYPNGGVGMSSQNTGPALTYSGDMTNIVGGAAETRIRLRGAPILNVSDVRETGAATAIDASSFYIVDRSVLVFRGWTPPVDLTVSYRYGSPPPTAGRMAARELAMEFVRSWSGDSECRLPERVTSVTRQGISYTFLDNQDFIAELRTGIYSVDLFLKTTNPDRARAKVRVFSPDIPRGQRINPASTNGGYVYVP